MFFQEAHWKSQNQLEENAVTEAEGQRFEDIMLLALKMQPGGHDSKNVGVLWNSERPWKWVQS